MTDQLATALTLRHLLLPQAAEGVNGESIAGSDEGSRSLSAHLERVPPAIRAAAAEQILALVASVLDRRLVDLLAAGWRKGEQLLDAGRRTIDPPGQVEIVELIDHEISWIQRPRVEVTYDGRPVSQVKAEVAVSVDIHAATAIVQSGRLSALRSGRADVKATLSIENVVLAEAEEQFDLAVEIQLGDGIPLIERPDPVTILSSTPERATR